MTPQSGSMRLDPRVIGGRSLTATGDFDG